VNSILPYSVLRGANVIGTRDILRLAMTSKLKPVHYVSTLSALEGLRMGAIGYERTSAGSLDPPEKGYR
jgi:thioester reductase-like protein